ncbi:unnamed protein product [Periconia digitata]|uniref:Uncharacterized protein n=1 Tax=Periconia digitata TaxID=1303443 RepID=A0A9W4XIN8_9PLEO|nr:unnamed protein product [Periconia digitata]
MDPIECFVPSCVETRIFQHFNNACAGLEVWNEFVVYVFRWMNVGNGAFGGMRMHGNIDAISASGIPMRTHHNHAFDVPSKGSVATLLPVCCRASLLAQHHSRAMRKEVNWRKRHFKRRNRYDQLMNEVSE